MTPTDYVVLATLGVILGFFLGLVLTSKSPTVRRWVGVGVVAIAALALGFLLRRRAKRAPAIAVPDLEEKAAAAVTEILGWGTEQRVLADAQAHVESLGATEAWTEAHEALARARALPDRNARLAALARLGARR